MRKDIANLLKYFNFKPVDKKKRFWITGERLMDAKWEYQVDVKQLEMLDYTFECVSSDIKQRQTDLYEAVEEEVLLKERQRRGIK